MKRILTWLFVLILVFVIGLAFFVLWKKSRSKPVVYQTETAEVTDIVKKTVATGSIVPRRGRPLRARLPTRWDWRPMPRHTGSVRLPTPR